MPAQSSCRLYTGCRSGRKQVSPELIRVLLANTLFDNVYTYFDVSSTVRFRSSSLYPPDSFTAAFSPSLTTTSLKRSSMRWFEACPYRPASGGHTPIIDTAPPVASPVFVAHANTSFLNCIEGRLLTYQEKSLDSLTQGCADYLEDPQANKAIFLPSIRIATIKIEPRILCIVRT